MDKEKGLLKGSKFSSSHTTVIDAAKPILYAAKERPEVTKIVIGPISPVRPAARHIKFVPVPAGLRMQIRGGNAVQIFYIYTTNPTETEMVLRTVMENEMR